MEDVFNLKNVSVTKQGQKILNVENLQISIEDKIGIIGSNGAGKTTLEKVLLDRIDFTGEVKRNINNKKVGVHLQKNEFNDFLKVKELLEICFNITINKFKNDDLYSELGIDKIKNKKIKNLSGGEQQKLVLFIIFNSNPDIIFLDEPTTGLDYEMRSNIINYIKKFGINKTIILVSHYFSEIEALADKVIILEKGNVYYNGDIKKLIQKYTKYNVYNFDDLDKLPSKYLEYTLGLKKYILSSQKLNVKKVEIDLEHAYKLLMLEGEKNEIFD